MIEFNKVSNESYFIKNLLYSTFLPLLRTVRENDYIIRDRLYIYKCNVIRCTSSGYIPVKNTNMDINQYPESLLRKTDDEKVRVGQIYYAIVNDSIRKIVGARGDTRSPIAEGWYEENIASYDIIGDYYFGEKNDKFCRNFLSSSEGYDYKTHEKLGQYLRGLRDMYGLNLLPLYNCFSNQLLKNIHITNKSVERTSQDYSTKVYKVPIRFNTDYTICMDNVGMTTFAPAFIHHGTLMKLNNNRFGNSVDVTNKYIKLNHNDVIHNEPNLRFKNPIKLRFDNVPKNKVINYSEITYTEIPSKYISKYYRLNSAADPAYVKREVDDAYMSIDYNNPLLEGHKNYIKGYEFIPGDFDSGLTPSDSLYPDDNLILPMGGFKVANITEDDFVGNEENYFLYDSSTFTYEQCQSGDTFDSEARYFYRSEVYESINPSIGTFEQISKSYKKCPEDETLFNETIFNNNKTKYYTISNTVTPGETVTNTGNVVSFNSTTNETCEKLVASIEPIQDLHGYDKPWAGGTEINQWDEEYEEGSIDNSGNNSEESGFIRSKNYISALQNTEYFLCAPSNHYNYYHICFYDSNKSYISGTYIEYNNTFTTPNNASYIRFSSTGPYGTTYNNDIAINYPSSVTTYSPYENLCPITGLSSVNVIDDPKHGGFVYWNQLCNNGDFSIASGWSTRGAAGTISYDTDEITYTVSEVSSWQSNDIKPDTNVNIIRNHKYFVSATIKAEKSVPFVFEAYSGTLGSAIFETTIGNTVANEYSTVSGIVTGDRTKDSCYLLYGIGNYSDKAVGDIYKFKNLMFFDLTLMFGEGNEPTTVDEFIALFPHDYYDYNTGEKSWVSAINESSYTSYSVSLPSTIYGGSVDLISGKLLSCPYYSSYNGEALTGEWISDRDEYIAGTSPSIGAQVVNIDGTKTESTITAQTINISEQQHNIFANSGSIEITHTPYTSNIIYVQCTSASVYDPEEIYYYIDKEKDEGWYEFIDNDFVKTQDTYIDPTKTYYKKEMTEVPVTFNYDITEDNCCMYDYIEDELYLLIQVPSVFDSNIVILEGDYTNIVKEKYYDPTKFELFSNSKLDYLFTKDLILMETNTKKLRPFSPTLIQFLLWNAICNLDTINNDLDRLYIALDTITDLVPDPQYTQNYWYDRYREAIFNYANEFPRKYIRDNLGYVTKDIERIIYQGVDFIEATDDLTNPEVYPEDMD